MTTKIAIVGLGQIGASIGLALKQRSGTPKIVGHDKDPKAAGGAEALGAVDSIGGLKDAVKDAEIVFLCLPLGEMRETLQRIGPNLRDSAVIFDTTPVKSPVMKWVTEFVPSGRYYLGLVPAVNPEFLGTIDSGLNGARADLFKRSVMVVAAPPSTPGEIEQLAVTVVKSLGAKPLLADMAESDGLMTTAHLLPQLTASALLEACVGAPGWVEARKVAGRPFAGVTGGMAYYDDPASLEVAVLANPTRIIHALDVVIAALKGMRDDIERGDEEQVSERLAQSFSSRERWLDERGAAEWLSEGGTPIEIPELGQQMMQMLLGSRLTDRGRGRIKKNKLP